MKTCGLARCRSSESTRRGAITQLPTMIIAAAWSNLVGEAVAGPVSRWSKRPERLVKERIRTCQRQQPLAQVDAMFREQKRDI